MRTTRFLRWAAATAAALGLLLGSSSVDPGRHLDSDPPNVDAAAQSVEQAPKIRGQFVETPPATPAPIPTLPPADESPTPSPLVNGAMAVDCDGSARGIQKECSYAAGARFSVQVNATLAPVSDYIGFQAKVRWSSPPLAYLPTEDASSEILWPDCSLPARSDKQPTDPSALLGCIFSVGTPEGSSFVGALVQLELQCRTEGRSVVQLDASEEDADLGTVFVSPTGDQLVPALTSAAITCYPPAVPSPTPGPIPDLPPVPPQDDLPAEPGTVTDAELTTQGGRIDSVDGRVTLEFPSDALTEPLTVRITHKDVRELTPIAGHPFMTSWQFEAFATDRDMARVDSFTTPIRIVANYTQEDLFGRGPDTLQLWTLDEATGEWEKLPSTHVPYTGTVVAEVNHFSVFSGTADANVLQAPFLEAYQTDLHTGGSQVTVPIAVPPGRGGLQPSLTLTYNSNLVNEMKTHLSQASWVGTGWGPERRRHPKGICRGMPLHTLLSRTERRRGRGRPRPGCKPGARLPHAELQCLADPGDWHLRHHAGARNRRPRS